MLRNRFKERYVLPRLAGCFVSIHHNGMEQCVGLGCLHSATVAEHDRIANVRAEYVLPRPVGFYVFDSSQWNGTACRAWMSAQVYRSRTRSYRECQGRHSMRGRRSMFQNMCLLYAWFHNMLCSFMTCLIQ